LYNSWLFLLLSNILINIRVIKKGTRISNNTDITIQNNMKKLFLTSLFLIATLITGFSQEKSKTETLNIAGLKAPVEIMVDHWGIPHIYAQNDS